MIQDWWKETKYVGNWSESLDMFQDFQVTDWEEINTWKSHYGWNNIVAAGYVYEGNDERAYVLMHKREWDRSTKPPTVQFALYEVHGGHCSCYGLEGQWEPERTTVASLRKRLDGGGYGMLVEMKSIIEEFITKLEQDDTITEAPYEESEDKVDE